MLEFESWKGFPLLQLANRVVRIEKRDNTSISNEVLEGATSDLVRILGSLLRMFSTWAVEKACATLYLQCFVVCQIGLQNVDVGAILEICIASNLLISRGLITNEADDDVLRLLRQHGEEAILGTSAYRHQVRLYNKSYANSP